MSVLHAPSYFISISPQTLSLNWSNTALDLLWSLPENYQYIYLCLNTPFTQYHSEHHWKIPQSKQIHQNRQVSLSQPLHCLWIPQYKSNWLSYFYGSRCHFSCHSSITLHSIILQSQGYPVHLLHPDSSYLNSMIGLDHNSNFLGLILDCVWCIHHIFRQMWTYRLLDHEMYHFPITQNIYHRMDSRKYLGHPWHWFHF